MSSFTDSSAPSSLSAISFQPSIDYLDDGYALCDNDALTIVYSNSAFVKWFSISALHCPIADVIPFLKTDVLLKRLNKRDAYLHVLELEKKKWGFPQRIELSFKQLKVDNKKYVSVHARDMTRLLEKEAQLLGHSRIIERNNRKLGRLNKELQAENERLSAELKGTR